ncbi:transcription factor bHLH94 [Cryptomeria japonica]|uniref:transcription factor bHLH94 n=1 Tax=Cryptomeria japonica TaxID=3369 RepID=UPI0027DA5223|nr:transcription factor bHLH94 [Cryptomeria japonica]XP_057852877.2 transcription factor bHLH94 [Cryptomeria japonica]XP_059070063.1 transcription factor bHLH94 [Cryptomeria japonica]XP_059070064.1 transcription factor bHLH94 [Cryptomeria japonica]
MNPNGLLLEGEPMGREEFLQGHDKLPEQPKSWGFQQLLTCSNLDVGREDELLYVSGADFNLINSGSVQGFEPESCITQVSEAFTSSLRKHNRQAKHQPSGQEEGMSSASCSEPLYSSGNKKGTCSTHSAATNKREGRKRKRSKVCNKGEEAESQRMTHIAVERNRRKQMNQHLNVLKSLMPDSFVQRGDQASIIGGAIDFVKELQHVLLSLEAQKSRNQCDEEGCQSPSRSSAIPNGFFRSYSPFDRNTRYFEQPAASKLAAQSKSAVADVEVTMTETRAALKVVSQKRPGQLLHTISALQNLAISILHMSITTISQSVLYSFNLKLEEECRVESAEEIASAVQQILSMISLDETGIAAY